MPGVTFSGFNGYDFGSIIDAIMQSESLPLITLQQQQQAVKDKDSAFVQLSSHIGKLQTQAGLLTAAGAFTNVNAASSDTGVVTTTLGSGAVAGRHDLSITFLAKGQVTASTNGYTATTDTVADGGSISFTIGSETTEAIDITSATTLSGLKDAINAQNSGVVASIVNTGSNYKLVISSRETGEENGFTINSTLTNSGGAVVAFAVGQSPTSGNSQDARDAEFTVNGIAITSASNSVADAISGVTLNLVTAGDAVIDVTPDYDALKESLKSIVTEYNKLREFSVKQSALDTTTGKRAPLAGDSVMRQAMSDLRSVLLGANANGGRYAYVAEIGLEFTATGDLKFDEAAFNDAINSYPDDVLSLFQGTSSVAGVFDDMKTRLDALDGTAGLIKTSRDSIDATLKTYRDRIDSQQLRLAVRREELQRMYAAADQAISRLTAMSSQLNGLGGGVF